MEQMTLSHLLRRCAGKFPGRDGLVWEDGSWNFAQWEERAAQRAALLADLGVAPGEHVALLFPNGPQALQTLHALWKLGAVAVPLNTRFSAGELAGLITHCRADTVIYEKSFAELSRELKSRVPGVKRWFGCRTGTGPDLDSLEKHPQPQWLDHPVREEDLACILYTAGTTGRPKGVMLTHRNCLWAAVNLAQDSQFEHHYRVLMVFPLFHAAALSLANACLYLGCTLVSMEGFSPREVMETVQRERLSKLALPPTGWNLILQLPDLAGYDTSSVESISSGASPMPLETKKRLREIFPRAKLGETYGMTETAAAITTLKPGEDPGKPGCVGRAFTNIEVRVVDDSGRALPPGQVGEVLARGPNLMAGYYRDQDETDGALRGTWLHTGDLGYLDQRGRLYLVDRKTDMIISGGENIYPREVEEVLFCHPDVEEAAVIGLPDPVWGERVHACIVAKPGSSLDLEKITQFCQGRLAGFKKPRSIELLKSIPRSAAGKTLKNLLRSRTTS